MKNVTFPAILRFAGAAMFALAMCSPTFVQAAESSSSASGFTATVMLTKKPEEFVRAWAKKKDGDNTAVETSKTVLLGQSIAAMTFFRGCRTGVDPCHVYVDYELIAPDGSVRYRVPDRSGTAQPKPVQDLYYLSQAIGRFEFKLDDPLGPYKIDAVVREPARGNVVRVSTPLRVMPAAHASWKFVQSIGGLTVGEPRRESAGWVLPINADVSGLNKASVQPTTLNSGMACVETRASVEGTMVALSIVTGVAGSGRVARCPAAKLGHIPPGKYSVVYRGVDETDASVGNIVIAP